MNKPVFDWQQQAACKGMPTDLFFPESGQMDQLRRALAVCKGCPVKGHCLSANLYEKIGIWGGTTARQRRVILRQRKGV